MFDAINSAYEELQKHWRKFPEGHDPNETALEAYKRWAQEAHDAYAAAEKDEDGNFKDLKKAHEAVIHPNDREKFFEILESREIDSTKQSALTNQEVLDLIYSGGLPNVPQHYKGNVLQARVVGILMNPGRDKALQEPDDSTYIGFDKGFPELGKEVPDSDESNDIHRLAHHQQPTILESLWSGNGEWDGWDDKHSIIKKPDTGERVVDDLAGKKLAYQKREDGKYHWVELGLESFCEIEFVPYQTPHWSEMPKELISGAYIGSINIMTALLSALVDDTVKGIESGKRDEHDRLFIVRGKDVLEFLLKAVGIENVRTLISNKLLFTFVESRGRYVSANNLKLVNESVINGNKLVSTGLKQHLGEKLNQLDWADYSFIEHPFEVKK